MVAEPSPEFCLGFVIYPIVALAIKRLDVEGEWIGTGTVVGACCGPSSCRYRFVHSMLFCQTVCGGHVTCADDPQKQVLKICVTCKKTGAPSCATLHGRIGSAQALFLLFVIAPQGFANIEILQAGTMVILCLHAFIEIDGDLSHRRLHLNRGWASSPVRVLVVVGVRRGICSGQLNTQDGIGIVAVYWDFNLAPPACGTRLLYFEIGSGIGGTFCPQLKTLIDAIVENLDISINWRLTITRRTAVHFQLE